MTKTLSFPGEPEFSKMSPATITIPKYLFRYLRDDKNLVGTLSEPYLWFSPRGSLNDPFELSARFKSGNSHENITLLFQKLGLTHSEAELLARRILVDDLTERRWLDTILEPYLELVNLCSLSSDDTSSLMWSHYAEGHTGVCVVFDTTKLRETFLMMQVCYTSSIDQYDHVKDLLHDPNSNVQTLSRDQHIFALKHQDWSYEKEYRLFSKVRGKNPISAETMLGVVFGSRMTLQRTREIQQSPGLTETTSFAKSELNIKDGSVTTHWPPNTFTEIEVVVSDLFYEDEELISKMDERPIS